MLFRSRMELHGIAWTRIALSLSQVVETSWPSPPGIFPRGQPPWVFPRGSLWWGNRRGLNLSPRLARPPCDAPLLVGTALEREPPQPPRVPVRIRLIRSLRAASLDHPPRHKKMCRTLDPGTSKGSNIVEHSVGARVCPVLASRGTYRSCAAAPHGRRMPHLVHRLGSGVTGRLTGRCLPGVGGADHAWMLRATMPGACRKSQQQAFGSTLCRRRRG